jgi:hypothetical protein
MVGLQVDGQYVELDFSPLRIFFEVGPGCCLQINQFSAVNLFFWLAKCLAPPGFHFNNMQYALFTGNQVYFFSAIAPVFAKQRETIGYQPFACHFFAITANRQMGGQLILICCIFEVLLWNYKVKYLPLMV